MKTKSYVIVGSGVAGVQAAAEIKKRDPDGRVTIFNGEPFPFYYRPALSYYFKKAISEDELAAKPLDWARNTGIRILNDRAAVVRTDEGEVAGASGVVEKYDRLLIATGAWPFKAPWIGADLAGVFTYRGVVCAKTKMDYIRKNRAKKAVVVGGGILGVEMVENLRNMGLDVTLLVREDRPVGLLFDEEGAGIIRRQMEADGVRVMTNTEMTEILGDSGRVEGVKLSTGETVEADMVVVAIGVRPETDFLEGSGVETDRGVVVDKFLRTNVEGVYAAGDVAVRRAGEALIPCRTWLTAAEMGRAAGANMAGAPTPFKEKIFFNASHAYRSMYAVVGHYNEPEGAAVRHVVLNSPPGTRAKVILDGGKVIGGIFIGHTAPAWGVYRAMENGAEIDANALSAKGVGALEAAGLPQFIF